MARKVALILILALLLAFEKASAGWELLRNSPTANDLHSVYFLDDSTGWIVGDNSTIFKTTNSGETWVQQTSPESSNFQCITFVSADTGWACGTGGTIIKTTNGGASWVSQTFTASKFNSMDFINADTGFICGNSGAIWKTINGGDNWTNQPTGIGTNLHQIKILPHGTMGFAVGDNAIILKTSSGGNAWDTKNGPEIGNQIFYSVDFNVTDTVLISAGTLIRYSAGDQGESWGLGTFPTEPIFSLAALGSSRYLGVGVNGYIVRATVTGDQVALTPLQSPTTQNLYSVYFQDSSNFFWAVGANGTILKNSTNWQSQTIHYTWPLNSVHFADSSTGWAVGGEGKIWRTTNSGADWTAQTSGTTSRLNSVHFVDASIGAVVGWNGKILRTANSGTDWTAQISGTTNTLNSVHFVDASTGYVVGSAGTLLKTTDSGANWIAQTSGTPNDLRAIQFVDASPGYIVGSAGTILKTTDSGANWIPQTSGTLNTLNSVYFIDANIGYAVGDAGTVLKTTDGGANWSRIVWAPVGSLQSVRFIDANIGYICGDGIIYKTTNGGDSYTWFLDELPPVRVDWLGAIDFVVENGTAVGFAVGDRILRTSFEYLGGGPTGISGNYPGWVAVNSGTTGFVTAADYINPFVAFCVGGDPVGSEQGMILRTINGGQTWTRQQSNVSSGYLVDISFADVNTGLAVGLYGTIMATTNAGRDWVQQISGTNSGIEAVDMLDINHAFACGWSGTMLHTSNGGLSWEKQTNGTSGSWSDVDYIDSTTATAVGFPGKIIRTTDAGLNWVEQTGGGNLSLSGVKFIDVNNGIAISSDGPVLRTTNGGANWVQVDSLSGYASDISFVDSYNAFIVTQFAGVSRIYRSTNGGLNWTLQDSLAANLNAVSFADENNGIVAGTDGLIKRTSNGGVISDANAAFERNGLDLPINDFQNTSDSINVNATYKSSSSNVVAQVYLTIDTVLHSNDGDLEFYLEHNGVIDTVIYRNGGDGDNFLGTFLNDETNFSLVSGAAPFTGSFEPFRPLSKFHGQNPSGYWKLRIYDRAAGNTGTLQAWSLTLTYTTLTDVSDDEDLGLPLKYQLSQNYPNPFNPSTVIEYSLPRACHANLTIYNILGQGVKVLVDEEQSAGQKTITWNGTSSSGNQVTTGIYFYRLQAGDFVSAKKMMILK